MTDPVDRSKPHGDLPAQSLDKGVSGERKYTHIEDTGAWKAYGPEGGVAKATVCKALVLGQKTMYIGGYQRKANSSMRQEGVQVLTDKNLAAQKSAMLQQGEGFLSQIEGATSQEALEGLLPMKPVLYGKMDDLMKRSEHIEQEKVGKMKGLQKLMFQTKQRVKKGTGNTTQSKINNLKHRIDEAVQRKSTQLPAAVKAPKQVSSARSTPAPPPLKEGGVVSSPIIGGGSKQVALPGLPNNRGKLQNVCYMNAVTQMVANAPVIEGLVREAAVDPQADPLAAALKRDLLALTDTMKAGKSEGEIEAASLKYWETYQANLKEHPGEGLEAGVGRSCDTVEYLNYLGTRLGIDDFSGGQMMASFAFMESGGRDPMQCDGVSDVFVPALYDVTRGLNPPEKVTVNGASYVLKGIVNSAKVVLDDGTEVRINHFTSTVKAGDGWVNQDDKVVTPVSEGQKDLSGVRAIFYTRER